MVLPVVKYGSPVLRKKGARIEKVTPEIRKLVADMLDTMYDAHGVGLAAQQIGEALQLTVIDISGIKDRPSTMQVNGSDVDPEAMMPLTLLNPEVKPIGKPVKGPEGCLSFPEIYSDVTRPETVDVVAMDLEGRRLEFRAGGLLGRAVQHEVDHLNGILFIDRMNMPDKEKIQDELDALQAETKARLKKK
jgi:peptide deformylase